ncbi:MAG: hypothetical protein WCF23_12075 [Candidatus Nitrosopolaris sp.]
MTTNPLSTSIWLWLLVVTVIIIPLYYFPSISEQHQASARCPNGSHKSPSGECEGVTSHQGLSRCPNGYHRSPSGSCEAVNSNSESGVGSNNNQNKPSVESPNNYNTLTSSSPTTVTNETIPSVCHMNGILPDLRCTPGETNPSVAQANIKDTICVPGYTKTVRPPVSFTEPLKTKLMQSYRLTDSRFNYELDHLIPLELGGNPSDVRNLWPEPGYGQYNFHVKDRFENYLHDQVCSGTTGLFEAQTEIATDWKTYWIRAGQP